MSEYLLEPSEEDIAATNFQKAAGYEFLSHRKWIRLQGEAGETTAGTPPSSDLSGRAVEAYKRSNSKDHNGASMWTDYFNEKHQTAHKALLENDLDTVKSMWSDPASNYNFWGFDELHPDYTEARRGNQTGQFLAAIRVYDNLLQLAAATGDGRIDYPEAPYIRLTDNAERVLDLLDESMGFRIDFPNPYPLEFGLKTSRGVASYRAVQALYQAYATKQMVIGIANPRVIEIGPGLGRAAYYCYKAGIQDYTLIDLPFSNVSQAFFLGTVLGEGAVSLNGEADSSPIKIKTPETFLGSLVRYDLAVNFDSFTEMDGPTQRNYISKIAETCNALLSVNHEWNPHAVKILLDELFPFHPRTRNPYWMRKGYVKETVKIVF